jgi:hypothetical protein
MRAAYEAELSRISSADMILQTAVSLLNIGGLRLGLAPGAEQARDLEQVRDAIDGVRALLPILERKAPGEELRPLRDALSQLQMAYASQAQAGGSPAASAPGAEPAGSRTTATRPGTVGEPSSPAPAGGSPAAEEPASPGAEAPVSEQGETGKPGPAQSSGRLWVPGR